MTSASAIRLYELLIQYVVIGQREIATAEFKSLLGLEWRYEKFSALERYVIAPSIQQVNEHSDILVSWSPRKTGRKISHLVFTIQYRKESVARLEKKPKADEATEKKAKSFEEALSDAEMASMARPGETWEALRQRLGKSS